MNTLRVWLIHRLGGVDKPAKDAFVEACLKNAYGGWGATVGNFTTTADVGPETHLHCRCSRCRKAA